MRFWSVTASGKNGKISGIVNIKLIIFKRPAMAGRPGASIANNNMHELRRGISLGCLLDHIYIPEP
jgi:hypothetical protein